MSEDEIQMIEWCYDEMKKEEAGSRPEFAKSDNEKAFIEDMKIRTEERPEWSLSAAQRRWIEDIYNRL